MAGHFATHIQAWTFIESFKSEPRHRSDFHEGTPKYNNNNNKARGGGGGVVDMANN